VTAIDWPALHAEALDIFVRYLQIDTSNPPGREAAAARFLGTLIEAEGIPCEYIATAPGREILVARLPGDGSAGKALMLCNHTDVVPVEAQYWAYPPFGGVVQDGRVYGRGAVDMKGAGVMQLMAFLLAARQRLLLRRDLVFCAVPDEETGVFGMSWLCEHRPDLLDIAFEINEGGAGATDFAGIPSRVFSVGASEKEVCWLRLVAVGEPGHGSLPHPGNSAARLVRALARLDGWDQPVTFTPETRVLVDRLVAAGILPGKDPETLAEILQREPEVHALFIRTVNVTMLNAGIKPNVIPARSEAVLDCRILPGDAREWWRRQVAARIADSTITVELMLPEEQPLVTAPWDTDLFRTIEAVITEADEDAVVTPSMFWGATDNRFLRARGIPAYGFIPCLLSAEERAGFHAHNEFLTVENLNMGCELLYEVVRRFCA